MRIRTIWFAVGSLALMATVAFVALGPRPVVRAIAASDGACEPARPHAAGTFDRTIDSGGLTREYILTVPISYTGGEAVPLLFNFHGYTSSALDQNLYSQLPVKAEGSGFILVTPQGMPDGDGQPHWNSRGLPDPEPDDVGFVDDLLSSLQSELCIDPLRVFSTGISNGGGMSSQLACSLSDRIAAIAPVAGARFYGGCSSRPVPVIAFHGTNDLLISLGPIEASVIPAWAAHNGCATSSEQNPVPGTTGVRLMRNSDCAQDATVELYVIFDADPDTPGDQGGGHAWPGSTLALPPPWDEILGLASPEISANDLMWEFFLEHPMPAGELRPAPAATIAPTATVAAASLPSAGGGLENSGGAGPWLIAVTAAAAIAAGLGGALLHRRRRRAR